jgi:ADP-ribosylglycohydrolase
VLGAIVGDYVGSVHEFIGTKSKQFELVTPASHITDDSLLTIAVADWILSGSDLVARFHDMVAAYPWAGWGGMFAHWARNRSQSPYNSFGNGAAMRVSPVGWGFRTLDDTLSAAAVCTAVTHNHPEGLKGAQATAAAIFLARTTRDKASIRRTIEERFRYDLNRSVSSIRPAYQFNETCQQTVPEALIAFLESADFEDAIRNAVSLGGDADTLACIAGAVAHAYYHGVPLGLGTAALATVPAELRDVWPRFRDAYDVPESLAA